MENIKLLNLETPSSSSELSHEDTMVLVVLVE